jgi:adenylyltransferase/sulfurtransferase
MGARHENQTDSANLYGRRFYSRSAAALKARLEPLGEVRANEFALRFLVAPYEMTVFPDGRAIVKGTSDTGVARSLYARYVG